MIIDRNKIQNDAKEAWLLQGKKGTLELATGTGKTITSLHCLYTMPKNDKVHLFLAETIEREKDLMEDILKYNKLFGVNVLKDYNLIFNTYQGVYRKRDYDIGLIIADEIHFALSPEYSKFFYNNNYEAIVGLSATIDRELEYEINGEKITKGDYVDELAPVCYTYSLIDSKNDGIGRELDIYVIHSELDDIHKTIETGSKTKRFLQTEKAYYTYWDKQHKMSWFIENQEVKTAKIRITSMKRSNILFSLPSKIKHTKNLLTAIKGQTIIFGNSLDSLLKVTNNTVSSRNTDAVNKAIREHFDSGRINTIGSFKKLLQGANLKNLDNVIIMSYYGKEKDIIQRLGRLRKNKDIVGNVFIFCTKDTQEEIWFSKMMINLNTYNIMYFNTIEDCINKYKELND